MAHLTISENLFERIRQLAHRENRPIDEIAETLLERSVALTDAEPITKTREERYEQALREIRPKPNSHRKWCKTCGGHVFTDHPGWGVVDVYAASIPDFPYAAGVHVNYQETRLRIKDGLPKMKDMPKEMGGSGIALVE